MIEVLQDKIEVLELKSSEYTEMMKMKNDLRDRNKTIVEIFDNSAEKFTQQVMKL